MRYDRYEYDQEQEYRRANINVRKAIKEAKTTYLEKKCDKIQHGYANNNTKKALDVVKELSKEKTKHSTSIQNA